MYDTYACGMAWPSGNRFFGGHWHVQGIFVEIRRKHLTRADEKPMRNSPLESNIETQLITCICKHLAVAEHDAERYMIDQNMQDSSGSNITRIILKPYPRVLKNIGTLW